MTDAEAHPVRLPAPPGLAPLPDVTWRPPRVQPDGTILVDVPVDAYSVVRDVPFRITTEADMAPGFDANGSPTSEFDK